YVQGGQILSIIRANVGPGGVAASYPIVPAAALTVDPTGATNPPTAESFATAGGTYVINLLEVAGEQQVLLRVLVAEVNRSAARSVGMNFSVTNKQGITVFANNPGPVSGALAGFGTVGGGGLSSLGGFGGALENITATFDAGRVPFAI